MQFAHEKLSVYQKGLEFFECAACLDIAVLKGLLQSSAAAGHKRALLELCKMLVGLRKSWVPGHVAEASAEYAAANETEPARVFYHETLDRYTVARVFYLLVRVGQMTARRDSMD